MTDNMYDNDFSNLGRQIQETVQDAIESMNYDRLNQTINQTVNQALDEARIYKEKVKKQREENQRRQTTYGNAMGKKQMDMVLAPRVKKGTGSIVVGVLLGIPSVLLVLLLTMTAVFLNVTGAPGVAEVTYSAFVLAIPLVLSVILLMMGSRTRKRYKRARRYVEILNGRGFCEIKELAEKTNRSEEEIRKDLHKMMQKEIFREAYLDKQETCLMINRIAYNYYLQAEESLRQREKEAAEQKEKEEQMSPEILEMIRTGDEYIRTIREANDDIPGKVISRKLDRLEQVVRRIFDSVKKHPEQKKEMDKFMDYYMPTTLKLVNAYREFDTLEVKGENITKAMQEIEDTLDTISLAFEKLLDDLFQDAAFDVSTDISVLQMMLEREGYKENDFK